MATKKYLSYDGLAEYDALIKAYAEATVSNKQDKLTGAEGQVIGFDADGNAVATEIESANRFFIMIDPSWFTMTNTPIWSMSSSQFESTGYTYLMSFDDETSEKTFNKYISEIHFDFSNGVYEFIFKESPDEHIAINVICIPLNDSYTSTFQLISGSSASDSTVNTSITIPAGRLLGDVNGDGIIDINDLNLINTAGAASDGGTYFGATVSEHVDSNGNILIDYLAADVDESGSITMMDTSKFLTYDNGDSLYLVSKDLLGNWSMVEGADASTEYPFYVDIQFEYADNHHDFIIIADNACSYISSQLQIVSGAIRIFARWLPVNDINAKVIVYNGNGNVNFVITPNAVTETINAVTETINASIDSVDTGSVFTQLVKPADVPESCVINIEDMFFQANGYTYLLYLIDAASENTYKKYVSKTTLSANALKIDFSDIPDSNIKMHFTRINVGSGTSRIAPIYNAVVQNVETGGKRTCRFTIGTSAAGWTAADCDYLCDGTEDNVEIQAAIDALPDTGGEIVILDGTYNISAGVSNGTNISSGIYVTKPNVSLVGSGSAIFSRAFQGASTIDMSVIIDASETNMHISGMKFVGNRDTYSNSLNLGIKVGSDSVVEDCIFSDIRSNMINGESFVCRNNIFEDWTDTCISVSEGDYVEFTGNKFILQGSTTSTTAISVDSTRFLCANNTFEYVAYAINATSVYDCNITGNVITNSRRNSIDISGVDVVEEDWYIEVAGNVLIANNIITNSEYARTIGIKLSDLYNAKCSNNIIRGTATGIHAYNIVNSVVSENAVYHSSTASIKLTSECKNNLVVSNTVLNYNLSDTSATIDDGEISIDGTGNTVSGNKINSGNPQILPITTEDNGKFMRVVNGSWAAVTVPSAEEASF